MPAMQLLHERVVVGIGGGIAAYKSALLVRELQRRGAEVRVIMTASATRFIGAATARVLMARIFIGPGTAACASP